VIKKKLLSQTNEENYMLYQGVMPDYLHTKMTTRTLSVLSYDQVPV